MSYFEISTTLKKLNTIFDLNNFNPDKRFKYPLSIDEIENHQLIDNLIDLSIQEIKYLSDEDFRVYWINRLNYFSNNEISWNKEDFTPVNFISLNNDISQDWIIEKGIESYIKLLLSKEEKVSIVLNTTKDVVNSLFNNHQEVNVIIESYFDGFIDKEKSIIIKEAEKQNYKNIYNEDYLLQTVKDVDNNILTLTTKTKIKKIKFFNDLDLEKKEAMILYAISNSKEEFPNFIFVIEQYLNEHLLDKHFFEKRFATKLSLSEFDEIVKLQESILKVYVKEDHKEIFKNFKIEDVLVNSIFTDIKIKIPHIFNDTFFKELNKSKELEYSYINDENNIYLKVESKYKRSEEEFKEKKVLFKKLINKYIDTNINAEYDFEKTKGFLNYILFNQPEKRLENYTDIAFMSQLRELQKFIFQDFRAYSSNELETVEYEIFVKNKQKGFLVSLDLSSRLGMLSKEDKERFLSILPAINIGSSSMGQNEKKWFEFITIFDFDLEKFIEYQSLPRDERKKDIAVDVILKNLNDSMQAPEEYYNDFLDMLEKNDLITSTRSSESVIKEKNLLNSLDKIYLNFFVHCINKEKDNRNLNLEFQKTIDLFKKNMINDDTFYSEFAELMLNLGNFDVLRDILAYNPIHLTIPQKNTADILMLFQKKNIKKAEWEEFLNYPSDGDSEKFMLINNLHDMYKEMKNIIEEGFKSDNYNKTILSMIDLTDSWSNFSKILELPERAEKIGFNREDIMNIISESLLLDLKNSHMLIDYLLKDIDITNLRNIHDDDEQIKEFKKLIVSSDKSLCVDISKSHKAMEIISQDVSLMEKSVEHAYSARSVVVNHKCISELKNIKTKYALENRLVSQLLTNRLSLDIFIKPTEILNESEISEWAILDLSQKNTVFRILKIFEQLKNEDQNQGLSSNLNYQKECYKNIECILDSIKPEWLNDYALLTAVGRALDNINSMDITFMDYAVTVLSAKIMLNYNQDIANVYKNSNSEKTLTQCLREISIELKILENTEKKLNADSELNSNLIPKVNKIRAKI